MNLRSCLLFLTLYLSTTATSMQSVTASWCADGQRERINNINTLIADYISKHNIDVLREESAEDLCQRKFISNYQFSMACDVIGNNIGGMLSNLVVGVILNRTYILPNRPGVFESFCSDSMGTKSWMIWREELRSLLQRADCSGAGEDNNYGIETQIDYQSDDNPLSRQCSYGRGTERVVRFDDIFNSAYSFFMPSTGVYLDESATKRANILFSHPIDDVARYESYGFLMKAALQFLQSTKTSVKHIVNDALAEITHKEVPECEELNENAVVTIGVHLRHKNAKSLDDPSLDETFDNGALRAMDDVKSLIGDMSCLVLAASDRNASLYRVVEHAQTIGCTARFVDRDASSASNKCTIYDENGPWCGGTMAVADWFLLTHSDYFIGSRISTFSFLVANGVAHRAAVHGRTLNPFIWLKADGTHFKPGVPGAGKNQCDMSHKTEFYKGWDLLG